MKEILKFGVVMLGCMHLYLIFYQVRHYYESRHDEKERNVKGNHKACAVQPYGTAPKPGVLSDNETA